MRLFNSSRGELSKFLLFFILLNLVFLGFVQNRLIPGGQCGLMKKAQFSSILLQNLVVKKVPLEKKKGFSNYKIFQMKPLGITISRILWFSAQHGISYFQVWNSQHESKVQKIQIIERRPENFFGHPLFANKCLLFCRMCVHLSFCLPITFESFSSTECHLANISTLLLYYKGSRSVKSFFFNPF